MITLDFATVSAAAALVGLTAKDVYHKIERSWQRDSAERRMEILKSRFEAEARINRERLKSVVLKEYYDAAQLASRDLFRYGLVNPKTKEQIELDVITSELWCGLKISLSASRSKFKLVDQQTATLELSKERVISMLADCVAREITIQDNPIYCLRNLNPKGRKHVATLSCATYFDYRFTYGALEDELTQALIDCDFSPTRLLLMRDNSLLERKRYLPDVNILTDWSTRISVGGVNVLLAFQRPYPDNDFVFYVKPRSSHVASSRGLLSTVPSGFHQPDIASNAAEEATIEETVYRETFEELFGGERVVNNSTRATTRWYTAEYPPMAWLCEEAGAGHFAFEIVSFSIDVRDGSYQFGVLLAINNPEFFIRNRAKIEFNFEHKANDLRPSLISTKDAAAVRALLMSPTHADTSLVAVAEALRRLRQLEPTRVKPNGLERLN